MKFDVPACAPPGATLFTADIACAEDAPQSMKLGLAVRWALANKVSLGNAQLAGGAANLTGIDLAGAILGGIDLASADLRGANLAFTYLKGANLAGANLSSSNLCGANLKRANLRGASLVAANLYGAFLYDAVLEGANFEDANKALATIDVPFPGVPGLLSPEEEAADTDVSDMRDPPEFTMPDGLPFSRYLKEVVPALLTAGGKTVREVVESSVWAYDSRPYPNSPRWGATPLGVAFGVSVLREVPPVFWPRAWEFEHLRYHRLIPKPKIDLAPSRRQ